VPGVGGWGVVGHARDDATADRQSRPTTYDPWP
jgi:hypothetical protein